jgi:hypothetical protein
MPDKVKNAPDTLMSKTPLSDLPVLFLFIHPIAGQAAFLCAPAPVPVRIRNCRALLFQPEERQSVNFLS